MSFPTTALAAKAYLALGADLAAAPGTWAWTDITDTTNYVRHDLGVAVVFGRRDGYSVADSVSATLKLDNRDGRFTRRNPVGAYYGQLAQGTPIKLTLNPGSGEVTRFEGYVVSWPTRWDKSGNDCTVTIECVGILGRLTKNSDALSALRRTITGLNATTPVAYWSLEDGPDATRAASGITGGTHMTFTGAGVQPGDISVPAGALSGITVTPTTGVLVGSARSATTGQFVFDFWMSCDPSVGGPDGYTQGQIATNITGPNGAQLHLYAQNGAGGSDAMAISLYDELGGFGTLSVLGVDVLDGLPHNIRATLIQNGADVDVDLHVDGTSRVSGTLTTMTVPRLNTPRLSLAAVYVQSSGAPGITDGLPVTYSHAVIYDDSSAPSLYDAGLGYPGEMAHDRIERISAEAGIVYASAATQSVAMGAQAPGTVLGIAREAEATDVGFLYETGFGWAYQSRAERENADVYWSPDFDAGDIADPPEPADDDRIFVNQITASRPAGSFSFVAQDDASVTVSGPINQPVTVNIERDDDLDDQANFRLRVAMWDEDRWPRIPLNFARSSGLVADWLAMTPGVRMTVDNPPDQYAGDAIDVFVEGWVEYWQPPRIWTAALNTSPARPLEVGVLAATSGDTDPHLGWADWDSCELPAAVNSSVTTWAVTAFPTDTTAADDFPRDVYCEGELVTCTASATAVADGFGRSASNGWGTADTGQSWATSGGSASDFSVSGGDGIQLHSAVNTIKGNVIVVGSRDQRVTVHAINPFGSATGAPITQWVCPRWTDSSNYYAAVMSLNAGLIQLQLFKRVAGVLTGFYSAVTLAEGHVANDEWIIDMQVLGSDLAVKAWLTTRPEPLAWQITATDTSLSTGTSLGLLTRFETGNTNSLPQSLRWDDLDVVSARTWTVTRNVNDLFGGGKAHAANAAITLAHPLVASL